MSKPWDDEVREALAFLNFFGHVEYLKEALAEPDKGKAYKKLVDYLGRMYVAGYSVHDIGVALRGKVDCDLLDEMDGIVPGPTNTIFRRTDAAALDLSKAADQTKIYFFRSEPNQDDEKMWEMYKGLARLTARLVKSYYADLRKLDKAAADYFLMKLQTKLIEYGCFKAMWPGPPL